MGWPTPSQASVGCWCWKREKERAMAIVILGIDLGKIVLQQMLRDLYAENDNLRLLIDRLTRHQFGRPSKQLAVEQLQLGLEDQEQTAAEHQAAWEAVEPADGSKTRSHSARPPA